MINLTYQQANAIANYICRQGLPLSASFQSDDSSDFIWESLEWLIENIKTWHTFPATLKLHATRMTTEEFIQLVCKLAGITLEVAEELPAEVEKAPIAKLQAAVKAISGKTTQETDRVVLWNEVQSSLVNLLENGWEEYTSTRGWLAQQDYSDAISYVLRRVI